MDARRQMDFHFKLLQANTESWSSQVQRSESVRLGFKVRIGFRFRFVSGYKRELPGFSVSTSISELYC